MIIGVDFDNTIVCYDGLFHELAVQQGMVPASLPPAKNAVRDYLRQIGQEDRWTELQGYAYGPGMKRARLFPGVLEFFDRCRRTGVEVFIISHRTRYPFLGEQYDLHQAARDFLSAHGFDDPARTGLPLDHIWFHETKAEKIARINEIGCTHFIDDLPEVLAAPQLNENLERILFDPNGQYGACAGPRRVRSWCEVEEYLLSARSTGFSRNGAHIPAKAGTTSDSAEIIAAVGNLLATAGLSHEFHLVPLSGGGNNRVYLVDGSGRPLLLKVYFHDPDDPRDRLAAEFCFSRFAWNCGIRCIPQPMACDEQNHLGLYDFIEGRPLAAEEIGASEVDQAAAFFAALNRHELDRSAAVLPTASEALFTLREHFDCVERRVQRLAGPPLPPGEGWGEGSSLSRRGDSFTFACNPLTPCPSPGERGGLCIDREAADWVQNKLVPRWRRVKDLAMRRAAACGLALDEPLTTADRCISPSDFGFHNAILAGDGRLRFIDFEYAGWDDPAKMICDFLCQPRLPVPEELAGRFTDAVLADCSGHDFHRRRAAVLLPVYRLKWCCIMMNEFLPLGSRRRNFACDIASQEQRKRRQLEKSDRALQSIKL